MEQSLNTARIGSMPQDLLVAVAGCLKSPDDLSSFRKVCRQWRIAADFACVRLAPWTATPFAPRQAFPVNALLGMSSLADLDLSGCSSTLSDCALSGILRCLATTLAALCLDDCLINDKGLLRLPSCTRLGRLSLARCSRISDDTLVNTLPYCRALEALVLRECRLVSDSGVEALVSHCSLRNLDLSFCYDLTSKAIATLAAAGTLETLVLSGLDRFSDSAIGDLAALGSLKELQLQACWQVTDDGLSLLAGLEGLILLSLAEGCESVSDAGLLHLRRLQRIQTLNLTYSCWDVSSEGLASLSEIRTITDLNLCGCYAVDDRVLRSISSMPCLERLNISECEPISDAGVLQLTRLTGLQSLEMCWAFQVTDYAVEAIAQSLTRIQSLGLSRCQRLTDAAAASLGSLSGLTRLHINKIQFLTDLGVESMVQQLGRVTDLDIGRCPRITDASLERIAASMPKLDSLNLIGCQGLSSDGLQHLSRLEQLKTLDLSGIPRIAAQGLPALPDLQQLRRLRLAGDGYLMPIQLVLNGPAPKLPRLQSLDFAGTELLSPGSQILNPPAASPGSFQTPIQTSFAAIRGGWVRRSRPNQGSSALPGLAALLPGLPRLRELRVSHMHGIPATAFEELSATNPKLIVVRVES